MDKLVPLLISLFALYNAHQSYRTAKVLAEMNKKNATPKMTDEERLKALDYISKNISEVNRYKRT